MESGWIKLHRQLLDWEWIDDPMMLAFWVHLLLEVNTKDEKWRGRRIKRGQTLTSIRNLADDFNMAPNTVRRILRDLETSGEIKVESDKNGTLITVVAFDKYQSRSVSTNDTPNDTPSCQPMTHQMTHGVSTNDTNIRIEEYKEKEFVDDNPPAHAREEFSDIENANTSSAQLVMMRQGWSEGDYLNAVREFKMTCAADKTQHDTPEEAVSHFRNWTAKRYSYGQRPLTPETPKPTTANDRAFAEYYRSAYGTEYVWQQDTTKAVQRIAAAIADKISEQGDISDPAQMPTNIRAFLDAAHCLGDQWLNEHFTPQTIAKQFNEIYNRIKNGKTGTTQQRKGRGNATGVSYDYLARIANDLAGDL